MIDRFRVPVDEYVRRSEENLELYEQMRRRPMIIPIVVEV